MPQGATGSAKENAAWRIERWGLASLHFIGDFWLLFLMTLVLGALFLLVAQGQEIWRHYILSPLPGPFHAGWALLHAAFIAGAFLFLGVVFARYALRRVLFRRRQGRPPALWTVPGAALLPLILALAGIAFAAGDYLTAEAVGARMLAAIGIAAGSIVVALAVVVALGLTAGAGAFADLVGHRSTSAVTAVVAVLLLMLFLGLPWLPEPVFVSSAQLVGALPALLLSLALVIYGVDAAFRATGPRKALAVGLLVLVGAGILFGDMATAHRVRSVGEVAKRPLPDVGSEFLRWLETRQDKEKYASGHYPVFVVAAQGGGLYAAHHTARVLAILQDECPAFAQHVFAISGVLGRKSRGRRVRQRGEGSGAGADAGAVPHLGQLDEVPGVYRALPHPRFPVSSRVPVGRAQHRTEGPGAPLDRAGDGARGASGRRSESVCASSGGA